MAGGRQILGAAELLTLGYSVESGKARSEKISRPVLFGENGAAVANYAIDAFRDQLGVFIEVEEGKGAAGNATIAPSCGRR